MFDIDPSSPSSSSDPPECLEDTGVVPTTTHLLVWAWKTLESTGSEIGNPFDTHRTISQLTLMIIFLAIDDPSTYSQAKDKLEWEKSMVVEYNSLMKNKTWTLVFFLLENLVRCKWIYKTKFTVEGHIERRKAWLATKLFS